MNKKTNKKQLCSHKNQSIKVIDGFANYEVTVIICDDCKKRLTKPKTYC